MQSGLMAMGKKGDEQVGLFVPYHQMRSAGHPFYQALDTILRDAGFDKYAEKQCARFYHPVTGRPGLAPGNYFRSLLVGYFEGIDSERGIAWRLADSLSLRDFLGLPTEKAPPDHSTISRTRRLIDEETHQEIFTWVLGLLSKNDLLKGKTIGVDATTLEANAALRSIVRRDDFRSYQKFLTDLAKASGIPTPTREDLARIDRKRKKKGSNKEWVNPHDPDAQISKMKDGSTHLAHKQEHAIDMDSGAVMAVTLHGGVKGDTSTIEKTLDAADENLKKARETGDKSKTREGAEEAVADKGYHSKRVMVDLALAGRRSYISEPARGRQHWEGGYFDIGHFNAGSDRADRPGFSWDFDAVEVMNGYQDPVRRSVDRVVEDWFSLLNHDHIVTATGNSDTYHLTFNIGGYPRNYVRLRDDRPQWVDPKEVAKAIRFHHAFFTTGPFVTLIVNGGTIGDVVPARGGKARAEITVQAAPWVSVDRVTLYLNGREAKQWEVPSGEAAVRFKEFRRRHSYGRLSGRTGRGSKAPDPRGRRSKNVHGLSVRANKPGLLGCRRRRPLSNRRQSRPLTAPQS